MKTPITVPIAQRNLFGQRSGGERFAITVRIGTPYQVGTDPEVWACPVEVDPLYERLVDQHGIDSFQALELAMRLSTRLLRAFQEDGGRLTFDTGEDYWLEDNP